MKQAEKAASTAEGASVTIDGHISASWPAVWQAQQVRPALDQATSA